MAPDINNNGLGASQIMTELSRIPTKKTGYTIIFSFELLLTSKNGDSLDCGGNGAKGD